MPDPTKAAPPKSKSADLDFENAVRAFSRTMPLLMHSCGDVAPPEVDPAAAALVAALTADYIASLVDAALEVHQLQQPSEPAPLPPPRFPKSLYPTPPPAEAAPMPTATASGRKKRRRPGDEFWDEPLPEPKIKGRTGGGSHGAAATWVGAAGCDLQRAAAVAPPRRAFVTGANALATPSVLFCVCHDAYAYGRATQLQAAKRSLAPLLADPATLELVRTEGTVARARRKKPVVENKKKAKKGADGKVGQSGKGEDDDEDERDNESANSDQDDSDDGGPVWPNLDALLPSYRLRTGEGQDGSALSSNVEGFW